MGGGWLKNKFCLLLWKNCILQKRHPAQTTFEILIPLIFTVILVLARTLPSPAYRRDNSSQMFYPSKTKPGDFDIVLYAPNTSEVEKIMNETQLERRGFIDEDALLANEDFRSILAAVIFKPGQRNEISYRLRPPSVKTNKYNPDDRLKWGTHLLYPKFPRPGPRQGQSLHFEDPDPGYKRHGFLFVQWTIDTAIIRTMATNPDELSRFSVALSQYPFPIYIDDRGFLVHFFVNVAPWVLMFSYMYSVANISKSIVNEREQRLRESMKMMGLPGWLHWSAWFTKSFILLGISAILMTCLFKLPVDSVPGSLGQPSTHLALLSHSDGSLLFLFLLAYIFSLITFGFLVASFCSKANNSATAAAFLHLLSFLAYFVAILSSSFEELSRGAKLGISLLSNSAMGFGMYIIVKCEGAGVGIQWNNIGIPVPLDDNVTFLHILAMLILDGFLYLFMAIYIEAVFPGEFGVPSPWYFPVMPSYWFGTPVASSMKVEQDGDESPQNRSDFFEKETTDATVGIKIMNLRKVFGHKVAVDGLTLNFYENQVTALLGPNGAGKTTTMSIITGLYRPTSGTALVNGFDIRKNIGKVHQSLGICPQHNVLFDELTVEEHLKFFCLLKGYNGPVEYEINRMLVSLNLVDKRNARSNTLSGGMKRKLSVGLALIGQSKVVLLDEPTAGMDPGARRSTWDLITSERHGKTILLSTHFMDEADLLADRIAILAHGKAVCCGSSLFLKQIYGGGYHLIMVKEPNCQVNRITEFLQQHIPEANVNQNIGTELSYSLPDNKVVSILPTMFEELEKRKTELGISSYGCSIIQMEEVFMRAGEQVEKEMKEMAGQNGAVSLPSTHTLKSQPEMPSTQQEPSSDNAPSKSKVPINQEVSLETKDPAEVPILEVEAAEAVQMNSPQPIRNKGCALQIQQLRAMIVKNWLYALRNKIVFIVNALLPAAFLILILVLLTPKPSMAVSKDALERPLDLSGYREPVTAMECSLTPPPDICRVYEEVAKGQSTVINTGTTDIRDYILARMRTDGITDTSRVYEVSSSYIVGLRVTNDSIEEEPKSSGDTETQGRAQANNITNQRHKRATSENGTGSQQTDEMDSGAVGLSRQSGVQSTTKLTLIGFFNDEPYHGAPVALNFISNSLLRALSGNKKISLTISNHPLPRPRPQHEREYNSAHIGPGADYLRIMIAMIIAFTMVFLAASFILFPIKERESKAKHLQFVSGVPFPIFWLGHWIFDWLYYLIVCIILVVVITSFQVYGLDNVTAIILFFLVLIAYGWAVIPTSYLFSFVFSNPSSAYVSMIFFYWITGGIGSMLNGISSMAYGGPGKHDDSFFFTLVKIPSLLVPSYNLFWGIYNILWNETLAKLSRNAKEKSVVKHIIALICSGLICHIWIMIIECRQFKRKDAKGPGAVSDPAALEDSDVAAENERIRNTAIGELFMTDTMILKDLTKSYDKFLAVDRLCLGVHHGECFGLLGVNGAGKTTTFMMLTGDVSISSGDAYITGKSVTRQIQEVHRVIGYCPQFDALIPELTGAETIRLYARLRGVHESAINPLICELGEDLLLTEHMRKPCGTYSGGNMRKLSTALALIGNPAVIFLDEPTAGLDPVARRHLWNTVIKVREAGTSVILTSHSMDECEALCTRLAIMVNGKFRCLGSTQHLKNKFGDGYTIIAQLPTSPEEQPKRTRASLETGRRRESLNAQPEAWELYLQPLRNFIETNFPDCQIKDMHPCYVHYHIPLGGQTTWADMFKKMEEAKAEFQLEAYSVGQTSLEQVFLGFAKGQFNKDD